MRKMRLNWIKTRFACVVHQPTFSILSLWKTIWMYFPFFCNELHYNSLNFIPINATRKFCWQNPSVKVRKTRDEFWKNYELMEMRHTTLLNRLHTAHEPVAPTTQFVFRFLTKQRRHQDLCVAATGYACETHLLLSSTSLIELISRGLAKRQDPDWLDGKQLTRTVLSILFSTHSAHRPLHACDV